jgi:hypothetical protein
MILCICTFVNEVICYLYDLKTLIKTFQLISGKIAFVFIEIEVVKEVLELIIDKSKPND